MPGVFTCVNFCFFVHQYRQAALLHRKSVRKSPLPCRNLNHLTALSCVQHSVSHLLRSFPLCDNTTYSVCPKYSPFSDYHRCRYHPSQIHCQENTEGRIGVMVGGWPPPCFPVDFKFWYVDSAVYGELSKNIGLRDTNTSIIVLDSAVRLYCNSFIVVNHNLLYKSLFLSLIHCYMCTEQTPVSSSRVTIINII